MLTNQKVEKIDRDRIKELEKFTWKLYISTGRRIGRKMKMEMEKKGRPLK